ncbi:MAG: uracil-xanthine permease [Clostridia bacterium]|nr:uracil-xanthine permease [Clostridia bacterium]
MSKKLVYDIHDKPQFGKLIIFAFQQLLAIMAATIAVPVLVSGNIDGILENLAGDNAVNLTHLDMPVSAALLGAGVGTLVYQLFTKFRSPVFLGSSFAFIGSMTAAFAGATTATVGVNLGLGYLGILIGALLAGLVYVIIAAVVKLVGVNWINKLMPAAVIGPTVALIGLSLSGAAIKDVFSYGPKTEDGSAFIMSGNLWVSFICAMVTLFVVILCSTYGKKMTKLIPFIIGVLAGYATGAIFTAVGYAAGIDALKIIDFAPFTSLVTDGVSIKTFVDIPDFTFLEAIKGVKEFNVEYLVTVLVAYVPVAFVVFAEHIADHKNLSTIIDKDLLEDPGLHRTLLGDGVGSIAGAFFGGCPNTTYGESVGCVAITKNASVVTITATAIMAILISFLSPFVAFLDSIPGCVMGGVCITLYGFIAVSGLKMIQKVDLEDSANLFTVSVILICGIGGMAFSIGKVTITAIACALILGIIVNILLNKFKKADK